MGEDLVLKTVTKSTLLGDIQYRGAISDFTVVKKAIEDADYDDILVRYNEDDIYGDGNNFELALMKTVADEWLRASQEKAAADAAAASAAAEEAEASKPGRRPRKKRINVEEVPRKPWVSQGSEREIDEAKIVPSGKPKVVLQLVRPLKDFGRPTKLEDVSAMELWSSATMEVRPTKVKEGAFKYPILVDAATQAVPELVGAEIQATPAKAKPMATQYEPREFTEAEKRAHLRDDSGLAAFLRRVDGEMTRALQQNECANIFADDFANLADDESRITGGGDPSGGGIEETHSFTSLAHGKGKTVACVDWLPGSTIGRDAPPGTTPGAFVVAASCVARESFEDRVASGGQSKEGAVLLWDHSDSINPRCVLEAPADVHCFAFNPENPALVAGGLANGRVCFWDTENPETAVVNVGAGTDGSPGAGAGVPAFRPKFVSQTPDSHVLPVTDLRWLGKDCAVTKPRGVLEKPSPATGACTFFVTCAADGKALFWDIDVKRDAKKREFLFSPTYKINMNRGETHGTLAAIRFDFSPDVGPGGPTEYFCASTDGEVAQCDFVKPEDEQHPEYTKMACAAHAGAVRSLDRSPFFPDVVVSVGDLSFKLFRAGTRTPIFSSPAADTYLTAGAFSPTRPGVLLMAKQDGTVDVWDLMDRSNEAALSVRVNSTPVVAVKFWPSGDEKRQLLAAGDASGTLHVLDLPRRLRKPVPRESELMEAFLKREMDRVADAEARTASRDEEARRLEEEAAAAKEAAEAAEVKAQAKKGKKGAKELTPEDVMEAEYLALEDQFMLQMGLRDPPEED
jgi:WD40 repeat protein